MDDRKTCCEKCNGQGWYLGTDSEGRECMRRCADCEARARAESRVPGVPARYAGASWETWAPVVEVASIVERLRTWDGGPDEWSVLLHAREANLGSGKTRILATVCRAWHNAGREVRYLPTSQLVAAESRRMSGSLLDDDMTVGEAREFTGLLALDDLGQEHDDRGGWSVAAVEDAIDGRYAALAPTIIATNLDLAALRTRYPRAWSRMHEGILFEWVAPDFRRRK